MTAALPMGFERWLPSVSDPRLASGPEWLVELRRDARSRVASLPMPTARQEEWRYTSLRSLQEHGFVCAAAGAPTLSADALEPLLIPGFDSYRAVLVNGRFVPELSALDGLPPGVRIGGLNATFATDPAVLRGRLDLFEGDGQGFFSAINLAALDDGVLVLIERGVALERPLEILHLATGGTLQVAQPRHLIALEPGAQATLVERYLGLDTAAIYCTNAVVEIALARDAMLRHARLQTESAAAAHLSALQLLQDAGSHYQGVDIGMGGSWSRTELQVRFRGAHAECDLQGLYLAGDRQLVDYHLDVEHAVPDCTSRETFKGILYGKGRAVFDGRVRVARDAQKTDAAMSNRNLLLSEGAEIDAKPQLEIDADDVKCSHGTTVGQIEPEMLFYLRSRGIAEPLARRMLCLGFSGEIIQALTPEPVREYVESLVGERLETAATD